MSKKPVVLMVLDGYGISDKTEGNAIALANTPVMDQLKAEYPYVKGAAYYIIRICQSFIPLCIIGTPCMPHI